jgi:hypothetical protein
MAAAIGRGLAWALMMALLAWFAIVAIRHPLLAALAIVAMVAVERFARRRERMAG